MGLLSKTKDIVYTKIIPTVLTISYVTLDMVESASRWGKNKISKNTNHRSIIFRRFNI